MGLAELEQGYIYDRIDFGQLLVARHFPERTDGESAVILAFLLEHAFDYDRFVFSKRIGTGTPPNPDHLPGVQANTVQSTRRRMDILAWRGPQPAIIEVKQSVTPATLGQILTYRHLLMEEFPDALEPELLVVGREAVDDAVRALNAHGVTVYLYPDAGARSHAAADGL